MAFLQPDMNKQEIRRYIFIAFLAVMVCVIVQNFYVFTKLLSILLGALKPLLIGFFIAYIFNIVMKAFEKHYLPKSNSPFVVKTRRPICLVLSFTIAVAAIILISYIIVPEIVKAFGVLYDEIPPAFTKAKDYVTDKLNEYPEIQKKIENLEFDWASIAGKLSKVLTSGVAGILSSAWGIIGGVTSTLTKLVLGIIFAI